MGHQMLMFCDADKDSCIRVDIQQMKSMEKGTVVIIRDRYDEEKYRTKELEVQRDQITLEEIIRKSNLIIKRLIFQHIPRCPGRAIQFCAPNAISRGCCAQLTYPQSHKEHPPKEIRTNCYGFNQYLL